MEHAHFISNKQIKTRIENSIEYILALYAEVQDSPKKNYREETYRVIILYCVSVIEALLLTIYHTRNNKIHKTEYKDPQYFSQNYTNKKHADGAVVVAVRKDIPKEEKEIGLRELVAFLVKEEIIKKSTAERIALINNKRNTFHLHKKGATVCTVQDVEEAFSLITLVLQGTYSAMK